MDQPKITVVIPTYKRPRLLARALLSVVQQEVPGLTVRVFDNASGDETEQVVREIGKRRPIEYARHATNIGSSANMQAAIHSVETPYCAILNDDDLQLPGLLASALEAFSAHPTAGAFCGRTLVYNSAAKASVSVQGASWQPGFYQAGKATSRMMREHFTPTAVVFATPALQGARFTFGDMEMMARVAERHDFVVSDRIFGAFVVHAQSWSVSHSLEEDRRTALRRLQEYLELETLGVDERAEVFWRTAGEIVNGQFHHTFAAAVRGERSAANRRDLARAAALSGAIGRDRLRLGERLHCAAVAQIAGLRDAPLSPAAVFAMRGIRRIAHLLDRSAHAPRRPTEAEVTALAQIAALDRDAEALFAGLSSR